jgi:glycosyltransferase involved in cell wall biosynthesis
MNNSTKVIIVMPAYNAAKTLQRTYDEIPAVYREHIILVDDCSNDNTVQVAQELGIKVILHPKNRGYGGNQKSCYKTALADGAEIVVMVHPDHQYDATVIPRLIGPLINGRADAAFGSRMLGGHPMEGGMPRWKYVANIFLTAFANVVFQRYLTEIHSGFRAYTSNYLNTVRFEENSNDFILILKSRQGMACTH